LLSIAYVAGLNAEQRKEWRERKLFLILAVFVIQNDVKDLNENRRDLSLRSR